MSVLIWLALGLGVRAEGQPAAADMVVVVGAGGEEKYTKQFREWADRWENAARANGVSVTMIGASDDATSATVSHRDQLQARIKELSQASDSLLWLVFIGHGTYDRRSARFNLEGSDLSSEELAKWLEGAKRPLVAINCASSSAPFINRLSSPGRILITATKSGDEQLFARFGDYLSAQAVDPSADLDKDGQTSLLEAFLAASRQTAEFYTSASRLATEHALLDDNGDGLGTPADFYQGVRAVRPAKEGAALDGLRAHQVHLAPSDSERVLSVEARRRRDQLEQEIESLRAAKGQLDEETYFQKLETLCIELARLYEQ